MNARQRRKQGRLEMRVGRLLAAESVRLRDLGNALRAAADVIATWRRPCHACSEPLTRDEAEWLG